MIDRQAKFKSGDRYWVCMGNVTHAEAAKSLVMTYGSASERNGVRVLTRDRHKPMTIFEHEVTAVSKLHVRSLRGDE